MSNNSWIKANKWNQACFDIIFYHEAGRIDVIQLTRAAVSHKYKLRHLDPFINRLVNNYGKCSVRFIVVVSLNNFTSFKIKSSDFEGGNLLKRYDETWSVDKVVVACDEKTKKREHFSL